MIGVRKIQNGTIAAAQAAVRLELELGSQGALAVVSGTWSGTLQFEGLAADAATWVAVPAIPVTGGTLVTSATANGNFLISGAGMIAVRVRASALASGTVVVSLSNAPVGGPSFSASALGAVNTFPSATGTLGALDAAVTVNPLMGATVAVAQIASVGSQTFTFEGTANGSVWFSIPYTAMTGAVLGSLLTTTSANGNYIVAVAGLLGFRVRCSTYASGTATCTIQTGLGNGFFPCPAILWAVVGTHGDGVSNTQTGLLGSNGASILVDALNYVHNGATQDKLRTPTTVKSVQATASGDTALWTPTTGKKFRLMRCKIQVTANAYLAARGVLTVKLRDSTTDLNVTHDVYLGQTAIAADTSPQGTPTLETGWVDLGNGLLSAAANNVLNVNLSAALSGGNVRALAAGTEE